MNKKTLKEEKYEHITHPFPPLYDADSKILILGSLPSVKSREQMFFYGHPQNRFWKVISAVLHENVPTTIEEKKTLLSAHHVALWDTIYSCDIIGSSDSSIKNVVPTDLRTVVLPAQKHLHRPLLLQSRHLPASYCRIYIPEATGGKPYGSS